MPNELCDICGQPAQGVIVGEAGDYYYCEEHGATANINPVGGLYFGKTSHGKIHVALTPTETACARSLKIPMENLGQKVESDYSYFHDVVCYDCRRKLDLYLYRPTPYYSLKNVTL